MIIVNYDGLWKILIDNNMKKKDLHSALNIGTGTIAKMSKGEPYLLCVFEDTSRGNSDYKINVEVKSRNFANNMNVTRIERHIEKYSSKYCIMVAPRFSRGNDLDISKKKFLLQQKHWANIVRKNACHLMMGKLTLQ